MELFRFGFHVLHDEGLAEEMVQETFINPDLSWGLMADAGRRGGRVLDPDFGAGV